MTDSRRDDDGTEEALGVAALGQNPSAVAGAAAADDDDEFHLTDRGPGTPKSGNEAPDDRTE